MKIRGQRFEFGEAEQALVRVSGVREVVACMQPWHNDGNKLTAVLYLADAQLEHTAKYLQGSAKQAIRQMSLPTDYDLSKRLGGIRDHVPQLFPPTWSPRLGWWCKMQCPWLLQVKLNRPSVIAWVRSQDMDAVRGALQPSAAIALNAPISKHEKTMQSVWASVLNVPERTIRRESNFMLLVGDSIAAMRAAGMCRRRGLVVPLQALTQSLSLAEVVSRCDEVTTSSSAVSPTQPSESPVVSDFPFEGFSAIDIEAVAEANAQASMVALGELDRHALVLKTSLIFEPPADVDRIKLACTQVLKAHEILRTAFTQKGPRLYQIVLRRPVDSQIIPDDGPLHSQRNDILPQFYVASDGKRCHRLRLEIHHALYDAISLRKMWNDVAAGYAG